MLNQERKGDRDRERQEKETETKRQRKGIEPLSFSDRKRLVGSGWHEQPQTWRMVQDRGLPGDYSVYRASQTVRWSLPEIERAQLSDHSH